MIGGEKRYKEKEPTPEKNESHKTHPPFCGDGPHDRVSGRQGGPKVVSWLNLSVLHGCSAGTGRADNPCPSGGGTTSSTCQTIWRLAPSTEQSTVVNSPS